jgi:hypothetical protein
MQLKNKCFIIETDDKSGYFRRITASNDAYEMNFVLDGKEFGRINGKSKHNKKSKKKRGHSENG